MNTTRMRAFKKVIAVDFDGTLHHNSKYPFIGEPDTELIEFIKLHRNDYVWILWTCREGKQLQSAIDWLREHGITFDFVNENMPERVDQYKTDCRKIYADYYIDSNSCTNLIELMKRL